MKQKVLPPSIDSSTKETISLLIFLIIFAWFCIISYCNIYMNSNAIEWVIISKALDFSKPLLSQATTKLILPSFHCLLLFVHFFLFVLFSFSLYYRISSYMKRLLYTMLSWSSCINNAMSGTYIFCLFIPENSWWNNENAIVLIEIYVKIKVYGGNKYYITQKTSKDTNFICPISGTKRPVPETCIRFRYYLPSFL